MEIVSKRLDEIKLYENNPRNNEQSIDYVAKSIEEFGFKVPIILDKNHVIVAGHTRYMASQKLGLDTVPCIIADDLTEDQIKAFRLADNKVAEYSEWDENLLALELLNIEELDMTAFGFEDGTEEIKEKEEQEKIIEQMRLKSFEHYDYIIFVFENQMDWLNALDEFNIKKVDAGYGKTKKIGIGRVVKGDKLIEKLKGVPKDE